MASKPEPPKIPEVKNPNLFLDPNTARFKDLYKYVSLEDNKLAQSLKSMKNSGKYIGGILAGCLLMKMFADGMVQKFIYGENGNGGEVLKMWTQNTNSDYYYNRHFQRMRYLVEEPAGDDPYARTKDALLADLGWLEVAKGNNLEVHKKAPHYKYF